MPVKKKEAPTLKKAAGSVQSKAKRTSTPVVGKNAPTSVLAQSVILPTEKSKIVSNLSAYTWLIYGEPKVGKTSLIAEFSKVLFAMFEPGGKSLEMYQTPTITDWSYMLGVLDALEKDPKSFAAVCMDTGSKAYDRCLEWVCLRDHISHPGKVEDYGASWKEVTKAFTDAHARIASLDLGFFVTAHAKATERQRRTGIKELKIEPMFGGSTDEFYRGIIDIIGYYHMVGEDRFLQIRGDDTVVAGCRLQKNFLTTNGEPIKMIPMGKSPSEAHKNIMNAFHNKQKLTYSTKSVAVPFKKRTVKEKR